MRTRLSQTEHEIMEFFWDAQKEYDFKELMQHFNEEGGKEWKKQTLNTFLSRLLDKGLLERKKSLLPLPAGPEAVRAGEGERSAGERIRR